MESDKLYGYILKTRKLGRYKAEIREKALDAIAEYQVKKHEEEYIQLMKRVHFREMLPINLLLIAIGLYVFSLLLKIVYILFKI